MPSPNAKIDDAMTDISALRAALIAGVAITDMASDLLPAVLVPKDMAVQDLEHLLAAPVRQRALFQTTDLDDFLTYCANAVGDDTDADGHAAGNPHIFYTLKDPIRAFAILDFGSPEAPAWGQHRAEWNPQESPALIALISLLGRALPQDTLTDYIDDWSEFLGFERADGTAVSVQAARGAIADMTAETINSLRSQRGDFIRERSSMEKITVAPTVPPRMVVTCAPWAGFGTHQLRVRISAADGAGTLALRLTLIGWPLHEIDMVEELRARLEAITAPITVLSGSADVQ
jgi:uncharacterized protein YfdQ (DUF2303 family)